MSAFQLQALVVGYESPLFTADLSIESGTAVILGPSGSGKSTLLATVLGSQPAMSGSILIHGTDVTHLPIHQRSIGMVFQDSLLFPHLTVVENVMYGLRRQGLNKTDSLKRALELLQWVGMQGFESRSPQELSGGQAQRVCLARALAPNPAVLLLDEPYSSLDAELRNRLATEVADLLKEREVLAIHVTHDESEAYRITDAVYRVEDERLVAVTS
jgi:ABC-type Fe3+/spermidine/putrescine transport system ATPase subunit